MRHRSAADATPSLPLARQTWSAGPELTKQIATVARNGTRAFLVHKPSAPIPIVPWRNAWKRSGAATTRHREELRFAHCLVGQPRSIMAPEVRVALRQYLLDRFPGEQRVFVHFSTMFVKGAERNAGKTPSDDDLLAVSRELGAVSINITHDLRSGLADCHARKASMSPTGAEFATLFSIVAWANVRHCFNHQVLPYEHQHRAAFDFVTRIRPDAVHFAPIVLPPLSVMRRNVVLPFRGIDGN